MTEEIRVMVGVSGKQFDVLNDHSEEVTAVTDQRLEVNLGNGIFLDLIGDW